MYESLREDILWLRIKPGTVLDEVALAERFEISRTPIREALLLLQGEWLVDFLPSRTSIVAPLTLENSRSYFDTHLVLARSVARAAALSGRADRTALMAHHSDYVVAIAARDYDKALRVTLALMHDITGLTDNIFLDRYFGHSLDSGIRTKILHYFPNAEPAELAAAADLQESLIEAISSGDPDASDTAMRTVLMDEINIALRSLYPAFGDRIDVKNVGIQA